MRKLIVAEFITLDGFISRPDGQMDFFMKFQSERSSMIEAQKDWGTLLFGRTTYETMVQFWPNSMDKQDKIAAFMNAVPKVVISSTLRSAPWGRYDPVSILDKDIPTGIVELKKEEGKTIAVLGSAITSRYLLENGLVDEYFLLVYPIVLGEGKSLFGGLAVPKEFQLTDNQTLSDGIVQLKYKVGRV